MKKEAKPKPDKKRKWWHPTLIKEKIWHGAKTVKKIFVGIKVDF